MTENQNYWNLFDIFGENNEFSYLHGIEIEYFLLNKEYQPLTDKKPFEELVTAIDINLKKEITKTKWINKKIIDYRFNSNEDLKRKGGDILKKVSTISLRYMHEEMDFTSLEIDVVGKDTNTSANNYTLELVTPPCKTVNELKWWLLNLQQSTFECCRQRGLCFLPLASHPLIPNNFCGEHHHIGVPSNPERQKIFNVMRLFLPVLSVMSYTSFSKESLLRETKGNFMDTNFPNIPHRSFRLKETGQLHPVPPLTHFDKERFAKECGLQESSARMVDLNPFTKFDSIEIRIFDTQVSLARTIATAILLQAICMFALDLDQTVIDHLNKIVTRQFYAMYKSRIVTQGLGAIQNSRQIYETYKKELLEICEHCSEESCEGGKSNTEAFSRLACNFKADDDNTHNLISFLLFPGNFRSKFDRDNSRLDAKAKFECMVELLTPYLKKLNLSQHLAFKAFRATLDLKKEPSMYFLYQYTRFKEDMKKFSKFFIEIYGKMISQTHSMKFYYDPFLDKELMVE